MRPMNFSGKQVQDIYIYIYICVFVYVCKGISYQGRISVGRILPGQKKIPGYHPVGSFTR